jgi:hypothetical protein
MLVRLVRPYSLSRRIAMKYGVKGSAGRFAALVC